MRVLYRSQQGPQFDFHMCQEILVEKVKDGYSALSAVHLVANSNALCSICVLM